MAIVTYEEYQSQKNGTGTAKAAPAKPYYSRPQVNEQERQKLYNNVILLGEDYKRKSRAAQARATQMEQQAAEIEKWSRQADFLKASYEKNPTQNNLYFYNHAVTKMRTAIGMYQDAATEYEKESYDSENARNQYAVAERSYNRFQEEQNTALAEWQSSIRGQELIQPELDAVNEQIRELYRGFGYTDGYRYSDGIGARNAVSPYAAALQKAEQEQLIVKSPELQQLMARKKLLEEEYNWSGYFKQQEQAAQDAATMEADMAEFNSWPQQDKEALIRYVMEREQEAYNALNPMTEQSFTSARARASELFDKYSAKRVDEIAESYTRSQNQRTTEDVIKMAQEGAGKSGWAGAGHSALSVGANLMGNFTSPVGYLIEGTMRTGRYHTMDPNNGGNLFNAYAGAVREEVAGNLEEKGWLGKVGSVSYQGFMSAADSLARLAAGGGKAGIALGLAGMGSFGQTMSKLSAQGIDPAKALVVATSAAGVEMLTEKIPLDNLLDIAKANKKGIAAVIRDIAKQAGTEILEEEVSLLGNLLVESAVLRDQSSYNQEVRQLILAGYTEAEARNIADANILKEAWNTALVSGISGGMSGTGGAMVGKAANAYAEYKQKKAGDLPDTTISEPIASTENVTVPEGISISPDELRSLDRIAKATGRKVSIITEEATKDGVVNGFFDTKTKEIVINSKGKDKKIQIYSHELTHSVEMADAYQELRDLVLGKVAPNKEALQELRAYKWLEYSAVTQLENADAIDAEIVAEYVADHLLTNEQSIMELAAEKPSLGRRILNWIDGVLAKLGNESAQERAFLNQAREIYARALKQSNSQAAGNDGTISKTETVQQVQTAKNSDAAVDQMTFQEQKAYYGKLRREGKISEAAYDQYIDQILQEQELAEEGYSDKQLSVNRKYSYAGSKSQTADHSALQRAKEMQERGTDNETIRQETGWFRGMDGKWRYEIDDSGMKYHRAGDALFSEMHPEYARHQELMKKWLYGELNEQEEAEFRELDETWGREHQRLSDRVRRGNATLQNIIQHDALFEAYPELRGIKVEFADLPDGVRGSYNSKDNKISLDNSLRNTPDDTLIHEIQHVIQTIEGFSQGSSTEFWAGQEVIKREYADAVKKAKNRVNQVEASFRREWSDDINLNLAKRYIELDERIWNEDMDPDTSLELEKQKEQIELAAVEGGWGDLFDEYYYAAGELDMAKYRAKLNRRSPLDLYRNTAGEIEARDVANRRGKNAEQRKSSPPRLGNEDTVFADDTGISFSQDISEYPYNMQTVIQDYIDAVDNNLLAFIQTVEEGTAWKGKKLTVGTASQRMIEDIARLTGVENIEGCNIVMNTNAVEHIQKRHGTNGAHDNTMKNNRDLARINYILQNYDSMELSPRISGEYKNRDNSHSPMVVLSKKINGTYFVIEAVPDTGKIGIVSAYMDKNRASQVPDENTPGRNVRDELASALNNNIFNDGENVNRKFSISSTTVSKKDVAKDLRAILNGGGSTVQLKQYIAQLENSGRSAEQKPSGADQILRNAKRQGISVEEYLSQNWEQYDVDGEWSQEAREALDRERRSGRRYSISPTEETESKTDRKEWKPVERQNLTTKARNYLQRAENALLRNMGEKMGVPLHAQRESLRPIMQEIADEYLRTGRIDNEKFDELFDKTYAQGIVIDRTFYEENKEIKNHLRTTGVTLSDKDKADIADWNDFQRRAWNTVKIVNDGLPVDSAYHELTEMNPALFPESITHPADQLQRMYEVGKSIAVSQKTLDEYYGPEREMFRGWAKKEFYDAVGEVIADLRQVKRFADEKAAQEEESIQYTAEQASENWKLLKDARRNYEKIHAKHILTDSDESKVARLLKGEILLENLDPETDNVKGITAVYEAKAEYERLAGWLAGYKRKIRAERMQLADSYLENANEWTDKRSGIAYSRETMRRNIRDITPDVETANKINGEFFEPVHEAEAKATRFKTEYRDRVRELNLDTKPAKGNLVSEAHAVQLLGEATDNIRVMENARGRIKQRDGKTLAEWRAAVDNLWTENPNLDKAKIENAVQEFRKIYDELFQKMNEVRIANGYEPVNYRQGYFPHFQPGNGDGIMAHFGKVLGIDTQVDALPTTINGLTHTFKPGIQWFGNAQERLGFNTAYDAVEGFDKYIEGVSSVIHQTENIQKLRALATQIRYRTSDEGIRQQVDAVLADTRLTEEEKQMKIRDIYENGKYTLSNFVSELDEYTNLLANKKSRLDRTVEAMMGRRIYTMMKAWESRVGANMIAGNISSAMTNFIPLTQANAQLDRGIMLQGMWDTLKAMKQDDGFAGISTFLINRRGSDPIIKTWVQKASAIMSTPMELIDGFTSEAIVRAAYKQNLKRGLSETEAMYQADIFASNVMADRSKGAMPTLFEARNPIFKAFTQFQLEVNNQFSEVFKDLPRSQKETGIAALAMVMLKYFFGAFLYNELYELLFGRRPALDPIGILNDTVGDLTGYEMPNIFKWQDGFETEKVGIGEVGKNLASEVLGNLPFSSGLTLIGIETDGGRLPASSAVPDLTALWDAATTEGWSAEKRWKEAQDELNKLSYVIPPFGGNQISKIWKGVKAYMEGGSYSVDSQGNDILQYPVYKDSGADSATSLVKGALFGKSSLSPAQDWVKDGFDSFNAKQTAVYQDLREAGVKDRDAYSIIDEIRNVPRFEEEGNAAIQKNLRTNILMDSDISEEGKAIVYYGMIASDSEKMRLDELTDAGADPVAAMKLVLDLGESRDLKGQELREAYQNAIQSASMTDEEKKIAVGMILGTDMETEKGNPTQYAKFLTATSRGLSVDKYMDIYSAGADIDTFLELTDAGINTGKAADLAMELSELAGDDVAWTRKGYAVIEADLREDEQMAVLSTVIPETEYKKLQVGYGQGISPEAYINLKIALPGFDSDGNGSYTQAEVTAAINRLAGGSNKQMYASMGFTVMNLSNEEKAVLWQISNKSWKPGKNPFDTSIGQIVYDLMHQEDAE